MVTLETHQSQELQVPSLTQDQDPSVDPDQDQDQDQDQPLNLNLDLNQVLKQDSGPNAITVLTLLDKLVLMLDTVQRDQHNMEVHRAVEGVVRGIQADMTKLSKSHSHTATLSANYWTRAGNFRAQMEKQGAQVKKLEANHAHLIDRNQFRVLIFQVGVVRPQEPIRAQLLRRTAVLGVGGKMWKCFWKMSLSRRRGDGSKNRRDKRAERRERQRTTREESRGEREEREREEERGERGLFPAPGRSGVEKKRGGGRRSTNDPSRRTGPSTRDAGRRRDRPSSTQEGAAGPRDEREGESTQPRGTEAGVKPEPERRPTPPRRKRVESEKRDEGARPLPSSRRRNPAERPRSRDLQAQRDGT
ncbi:hypothetical protein WMY93_031548 [Mugilogobius chulae]|uniref:Uncharacterized protein n=1 Tax=Mugilogobius chulae TaxID=88201 RepID=A0AAW0MMQ6_9GOBI